jgi:hypothetical protein
MKPEIFSVVFHVPPAENWLGAARTRDLRLATAAALAEVVGLEQGVMVLPAGFFRAPTPEGCADLAASLKEISELEKIAIVFGADQCQDEPRAPPTQAPSESWLYACSSGRPLLWPARPRSSLIDAGAIGSRCIRVGELTLGAVLGVEVFSPSVRRELIHAKPNVICVLTHFGPTARWHDALLGLSAIAPVIVSGATTTGVVPAWTAAPRGWEREELSTSDAFSVLRYAPVEERLAAADQA